jgi:hypothetical protein
MKFMTRNEYLLYRGSGNLNIVYQYYAEKFDHKKHSPFLSANSLVQFLTATGYDLNDIMGKCLNYFDEKFSVITILDSNNRIIKYI